MISIIISFFFIYNIESSSIGSHRINAYMSYIPDTCNIALSYSDSSYTNCNCYNIFYSSQGDIIKMGERIDCIETGKWVFYGDSAKILKVINYLNGQRHGEYIKYWTNGNISVKCFFERDLYHGTYESYDTNGDPIEKITYNLGKVILYEKYKFWEPDGTISYKWLDDTIKTYYDNQTFLDNRSAGVYIWHRGELFFLRNLNLEELKTNTPSSELNKAALEYYIFSK